MRYLIPALFVLLLAAPASAQTCTGAPPNTLCTGPVSTATRFVFTAPDNAPTVALAQALEYRAYVDNATTFHVLGAVQCAIVPPATIPECRGTTPASLAAVMNVVGVHTVTLRGFHQTAGEGPSAIPFELRSPPAAPTGVRILPGQ